MDFKEISIIVGLIPGIGAVLNFIISYNKSVKTKAAEIFLFIEQRFTSHIQFLNEIEIDDSYKQIETAIKKAFNQEILSPVEIEIINKLDSLLRHFTTCYQIKKLNIDKNTIEKSYFYYLQLFLKPQRTELRNYIARYFKLVNSWLLNFEIQTIKR